MFCTSIFVTRSFAVGNFTTGNFTAEKFALPNRKVLSCGNFAAWKIRRAEFSLHETFATRKFRRGEILPSVYLAAWKFVWTADNPPT